MKIGHEDLIVWLDKKMASTEDLANSSIDKDVRAFYHMERHMYFRLKNILKGLKDETPN